MFVIVHGGLSARLSGIPPVWPPVSPRVPLVSYGAPVTDCPGYAGPRMAWIVTRFAAHATFGFQDGKLSSKGRGANSARVPSSGAAGESDPGVKAIAPVRALATRRMTNSDDGHSRRPPRPLTDRTRRYSVRRRPDERPGWERFRSQPSNCLSPSRDPGGRFVLP